MAEIKSTLDMVLERAARLAAESQDIPAEQPGREDGMRLAVAYLNGDETDLLQLLNQSPQDRRMSLQSGISATLLRNIILPRGDLISEQSLRALSGLHKLSGSAADIGNICSELKQLLEQYGQHRTQVKQQFDESIVNQLRMGLQQQGVPVEDTKTLNPAMHPKYHEEWTRVSGDLNGQYQQALDQRKRLIAQRFAI